MLRSLADSYNESTQPLPPEIGRLNLWIANRLKSLGRITEAESPMLVGYQQCLNAEDWLYASKGANDLCELYSLLGNLPEALIYGQQSVELSIKTSVSERNRLHSTPAYVCLQMGDLNGSEIWFNRGSLVLLENNLPNPPNAYWSFRYCEFLLATQKYEQAFGLARQRLDLNEDDSPEIIGLDNLSMSKIILSVLKLPSFEIGKSSFLDANLSQLEICSNKAVDELRAEYRQEKLAEYDCRWNDKEQRPKSLSGAKHFETVYRSRQMELFNPEWLREPVQETRVERKSAKRGSTEQLKLPFSAAA